MIQNGFSSNLKKCKGSFLNCIAYILPTCHIQDRTVQECLLCQGLTLTDLCKPPTWYATGIEDQLGQSFCAAMAQTVLKIKFCCCIYCKLSKKDFTEHIKAILKLSPILSSINSGLMDVSSATWLNCSITFLASCITQEAFEFKQVKACESLKKLNHVLLKQYDVIFT